MTSRLLHSVNGIMILREKEGREEEKEGGRKGRREEKGGERGEREKF